jgi:hypothetical protein
MGPNKWPWHRPKFLNFDASPEERRRTTLYNGNTLRECGGGKLDVGF